MSNTKKISIFLATSIFLILILGSVSYGCLSLLLLIFPDYESYNLQKTWYPVEEKFPELASSDQQWHMKDLMHVAKILHQEKWGEPIENWKIREITITQDCSDTDVGFNFGRVSLFKREFATIYFSEAEVYAYTNEDVSVVIGVNTMQYSFIQWWPTLDWNDLKISPSQAYDIAEQNGGADFRKAVNNSCFIGIYLHTHFKENDVWEVTYFHNDSHREKTIYIDSYSGDLISK